MQDKEFQWKARRGLKELDIILQSFIPEHLSELSQQQKATLAIVLDQDDMTLLSWLSSDKLPPIPEKQKKMIRLMQKAHKEFCHNES